MSEHDNAHFVRIHIDRGPKESPNPTTGVALYELGQIGPHEELFREVGGDKEDELVPRDDQKVHLKEDEHFYSQKEVILIVDGEEHPWVKPRISFEQVVKLAYPVPPPGTCIEFTVTFRHGPPENPKGPLTAGHSAKVKNRMIFDVTPTDRS